MRVPLGTQEQGATLLGFPGLSHGSPCQGRVSQFPPTVQRLLAAEGPKP